MSTSNQQYEPTMEEILASIRKMIADDPNGVRAPEFRNPRQHGQERPCPGEQQPRQQQTAISELIRLYQKVLRRHPALT